MYDNILVSQYKTVPNILLKMLQVISLSEIKHLVESYSPSPPPQVTEKAR